MTLFLIALCATGQLWLIVLFATVFLGQVSLFFGVCWSERVRLTANVKRPPLLLPAGVWVAVFQLVNMSIPATQWPLHAAFHVALPSLERHANRVESGVTVTTPFRAGPFVVREVEIRGEAICLWTDPDPAGWADWFVVVPVSKAGLIFGQNTDCPAIGG